MVLLVEVKSYAMTYISHAVLGLRTSIYVNFNEAVFLNIWKNYELLHNFTVISKTNLLLIYEVNF